ncbi:MAG TPA: cytochrome c [Thermoanaerobaculia bacterium]|nr:cytochrome c [Thermoanaerobaculia bacterium]
MKAPRRWCAALIAACCAATFGCPAAMAAAAAADTTVLFKDTCSGCHGANGSGTPLGRTLKVRDLRTPEVQSMSAAELAGVITRGKGAMPSFEKKLSEAEIARLVDYIRTLKRSQ